MPCTYYSEGEEKAIAQEETRRVRAELDLVTRLLCQVLDEVGAHTPAGMSESSSLATPANQDDEED